MLVGLAIGLFVGLVMGVTIVALMTQGKTSDLYDEISRLNNALYRRDAQDYEEALAQLDRDKEEEDEIGLTD